MSHQLIFFNSFINYVGKYAGSQLICNFPNIKIIKYAVYVLAIQKYNKLTQDFSSLVEFSTQK